MSKGKSVKPWQRGYIPTPGKNPSAGLTVTPEPAGWARVGVRPHHFYKTNNWRRLLIRERGGWKLYEHVYLHDETTVNVLLVSTLDACLAFDALDVGEEDAPSDVYNPAAMMKAYGAANFIHGMHNFDFSRFEQRVAAAMVYGTSIHRVVMDELSKSK